MNQYGRAFGPRSLDRVWRSLAAYDDSSSSAAGSTLVRPRIVLTMTGKKTITATIVIRGRRLSGPNQFSVIGAKAMIGIVLAPMATGSSISRALAQRAVAKPHAVPSVTPMTSPPTASVPVKSRPRTSVDQSAPSCSAMTLGRGIRNDWTPRTRKPTSHGDDDDHEHDDRRQPLPRAPSTPAHARPSARTRSASMTADPRRRRLVLAERLADARDEPEVALRFAGLDRSLGGQVDVDDLRDPARPRRHDDDPGRQEDGLGDAVGHEHDGRPGPPPDAHQLGVHPLAGHLVERPERLVHEQQLRVERQGPGDRDALLHPARQLPGMPIGERLELDQLEELGRRAGAARSASKPMISSGSSMFLAIVRQSIRTGAWKTMP